jgi:5-hydroxyisourate hydrolase-like protein (transthyretin family)
MFIACLCITIRAESTSGTISGIVLDAQGNPAKDCIVVAQQAAEKMRDTFEATTDEKGAFKLENVPEGEYNIKVRTRDLKAKATKSVTVTAGKTADVGTLKLKGK